jgi:alpha-tubulin suppressor-like RCC1 family protein
MPERETSNYAKLHAERSGERNMNDVFRGWHTLATLLACFFVASAAQATTYVTVSAGSGFTCARTSDSNAVCWGNNQYGQLGNGSTLPSPFPVRVTGLGGGAVLAVSAGYDHACALLDFGGSNPNRIRCWGRNSAGQLGNNTTGSFSSEPVDAQVPEGVGFTSVSAGQSHTCARATIDSSSRFMCWGQNTDGRLGDGTTVSKSVPTLVSGSVGVALSIAAGREHTCAIYVGGTVRCWGDNTSGEVGNGTASSNALTPTLNSSISSASSISAGFGFSCARLADATLRCWGSDTEGRLGDAIVNNTTMIPVTVDGISNAFAVDAGNSSACAVLTNGGIRCWGLRDGGILGDGGATGGIQQTPVEVQGISVATHVSVGLSHACARLNNGSIWCWGAAPLGTGTSEPGPVITGCTMDIDADGHVLTSTDSLLLARAAAGLSGDAVITGALAAGAQRKTWSAIRSYLELVCGMTGLAP